MRKADRTEKQNGSKETFLFRIVAPHFVAGLEILEGSDVVIRTAPIVGYLRGQSFEEVLRFVEKRKWEGKVI